jgi:apolipoprotein N-acyltransferase
MTRPRNINEGDTGTFCFGSYLLGQNRAYILQKNRWFLAFISGSLLFLSFPKYGVGSVAWMALVPLLFALRKGSVKSALATGFFAGLVFNVGLIYWIALVVVNYGYLPLAVGLLAVLFLAAYLSIYVALFAGGVAYLRDKGINQLIAAPLLWTCLEYLKSHLLTGFPWENLGYSQYLNPHVIQIADIAGIYGITFVIVFINAVICAVICSLIHYRLPGAEGKRWQRPALEFSAALLMMIAIFMYGELRIGEVQAQLKTAPSLDVRLVQGNIDQSIKWNPQNQQETLTIYKSLSNPKPATGSGLIVWPETAVPFYFQDLDDRSRQVYQVAKETGNWLLFGSPSYRKESVGASYLNSAFLVSPEGDVAGRYDKVHLVPYGEYVPLRSLFPFIGKLVVGVGDFRAGEGYHPVTMKSIQLGVLICYEAIFPEASRRYKNNGAQLLVNITNDAWFGFSSAPYQHLSMTVFRAVENRLYVVRAANTGISAIVDPTGNIVARTPLFTATSLSGQARFIDTRTFYMAYGDAFVYLCLISLAALLLNFRKRRTT